jgi:hypothetical protein
VWLISLQLRERELLYISCNIATEETAPILIKSAEFIAERLPSVSTAEANSSPLKHL